MKTNRVITLFLILLSILFTGCSKSEPGSIQNNVITGDSTDPTYVVIEAQNSGENMFLQVLQNQTLFYSVSGDKSVALSEYCTDESIRMGFEVTITRYAFADMDGDNIQEAIVDFRFGENNQVMCMVLKWDNRSETVYGTEFYHRQMSQIKEDGSFAYSDGDDNDGWAKLRWENNAWVTESVEDSDHKADIQWYSYPVATD